MKMVRKTLILIIKIYQKTISNMTPNCCRFYPSCSAYSIEVLQKHDLAKSLWLIFKRIIKCHPYHKGGLNMLGEEK